MKYFCKGALLLFLLPVFSIAQSNNKQTLTPLKGDTLHEIYTKKYAEDGKFNFFATFAVNISHTTSAATSPFTAGGDNHILHICLQFH
jgi:hypothetical protein